MVKPVETIELMFRCAMQDHQAIWEQKKSKILEQLSQEEFAVLMSHSIRYAKARGEIFTPAKVIQPESIFWIAVTFGFAGLRMMEADFSGSGGSIWLRLSNHDGETRRFY